MSDLEKIRIPKIKTIVIPTNRVIHIDDKIFGKLVIKLLNEKDNFVEGWDIQIPGYCGEECFITVPKTWINKKVIVMYEREVMAKRLNCNHDKFPKFDKLLGLFTIDGWTIDYPDNKGNYYHIFYTE